ncbi:MAG: DUF3047 domain-containing protein [Candidatus Lambdaproteobacteria bacterium]|nr:DUF3047 domain-containing protein [Candidatus Lambdaproteobacteria bacterium]
MGEMNGQAGRLRGRVCGAARRPIRCTVRRPIRRGVPWLALLPVWAALAAPAPAQEALRLDRYEKTYPANEVIPDWDARKFSPVFGSGDTYFYQFVWNGAQDHHLHVKSGADNSFSVGSTREFLLSEYPILSWEWKVTRLPTGGDVRVRERDDQAGSVCVIVNPGLRGFESLCYLWENDGPKDTPLTSTQREDSRYLILRTAKGDGAGVWLTERRNILADYRRVFGKAPTRKAVVGIQIDSNDTKSAAEAFYRNLVLHKS